MFVGSAETVVARFWGVAVTYLDSVVKKLSVRDDLLRKSSLVNTHEVSVGFFARAKKLLKRGRLRGLQVVNRAVTAFAPQSHRRHSC